MLAHFFACVAAFAAIPDVIPSGYKHISVTLRFDAQPLVDHCCTQHVIKKGETLEMIAAKMFGNRKVVADILELNPGIDPRRLAIGQSIWLPPGLESARKQPKTFAFYAANWPLEAGGRPLNPAATARPPRYGKLAILLVPEKQMAAYKKSQRDWKVIKKMAADKAIKTIEVTSRGANIRETNPTHKRVDTVKIHRDEKGNYRASVSSVAYDKKGKVLSGDALKKIGTRQGMWLLLLPVCGAGFLLTRSRRRAAPAVA